MIYIKLSFLDSWLNSRLYENVTHNLDSENYREMDDRLSIINLPERMLSTYYKQETNEQILVHFN